MPKLSATQKLINHLHRLHAYYDGWTVFHTLYASLTDEQQEAEDIKVYEVAEQLFKERDRLLLERIEDQRITNKRSI